MDRSMALQIVGVAALTVLFLASFVYGERLWSLHEGQNTSASAQGASLGVVNSLTKSRYQFALNRSVDTTLLGDFVCNRNAYMSPLETDLGQYTYCQNNGVPVKVALAWKERDLQKLVFLERVVGTIVEETGDYGEYECREDASFKPDIGMYGIVSDCVVIVDKTERYYTSAFFFYPESDSGMSQVLYTYSTDPKSPKKLVTGSLREIANSLERAQKTLSFFSIPVAYAQDGGGGDGGGDAGGGCGCGGDGGGDGGGGTGGGGAPGDNGGPNDPQPGNPFPGDPVPPGDVGQPSPDVPSDGAVTSPDPVAPPSNGPPENGGGNGDGDEGYERDIWFNPRVLFPPVRPSPSRLSPLLWADTYISTLDEPVTLYWNTRNGDESRCSLVGPGLGTTHTPIPHENGDQETGHKRIILNGRSTYTLNCEGRIDRVILDVIPLIWES